MAGRFGQAHAAGYDGLVDLAAEVFLKLKCDLLSEVRPRIKHGEDDALDIQARIQALFAQLDRRH